MPRPAKCPSPNPRFGLFFASLLIYFLTSFFFSGCSRAALSDPSSLTLIIESNPANLDPRFATDAQSAHIDSLLFGGLLERDNQMNLHGDLAESWKVPDPLTYIFHLRRGIRFHDGRPLTSSDVKATFDFILNPSNRSPKRGGFRMVTTIETPDDATVIFHLKEPYASFTVNLLRSAVGIVPANASADFARHPIGSGPFLFVSQAQDEEVVLDRNPDYFRGAARISRLRIRVVPDAIVRALELRKGSADLEISSLAPDMVPILARQPELSLTQRPGTNFVYLGFNLEDPVLSRREVRQALAFATDREGPHPLSPPRPSPRSLRHSAPESLGLRTRCRAIHARYATLRKTPRRRRLPPPREWHSLPSHSKNVHRRAVPPHRRRPTGSMAPRRD